MDYIPGTFRNTFRVVSLGLLFLSGCATSVPSEQAGRMSSTAPQVTASLNEIREVGQAAPGVKDVAFGEDDDQVWKISGGAGSRQLRTTSLPTSL